MENKELYITYFDLLRERVSEKNLLNASPIYGSIHIALSIIAYIFGLSLIGQISPIWIILYFYILSVELWFISHDLIHNQYFKNKKLNYFFSFVSANLLIGLSRSWWMKKHNIDHHTFTNSDIHDSDIRDYDEIFTKNPGKSKFFHAHKVVLFWFVTGVLYFNLVFLSYKFLLQNRKFGELSVSILSLFLLPLGLFLYYWFLGMIWIISIIYILVWVHLAYVFMVNHVGMEIIDGTKVKEYSWLDLQTRTSRNILGWSIIHHVFGGLNKQIEHHLFPQASRYNIVAIAQITKDFCKEKGIKYHDVSFITSMKEIYNTLKTGKTL